MKKFIKFFVLLALILVTLLVGFFYLQPRALVTISYSGGWIDPDQEANAPQFYKILSNGDVVMQTRGGEKEIVTQINASDVQGLKQHINQKELEEAFIKKERGFCFSQVDGIDVVYSFSLSPWKTISFSSCDYDPSDSQILSKIHECINPSEYK